MIFIEKEEIRLEKFENFSFDNISLDEFKDDIDDINNTFNELMKDRKIKKIYNKLKKMRDKEVGKWD